MLLRLGKLHPSLCLTGEVCGSSNFPQSKYFPLSLMCSMACAAEAAILASTRPGLFWRRVVFGAGK